MAELAERLEAWSITIRLTVDNQNCLEWFELSPLGIDVSRASAQLRALELEVERLTGLLRYYDDKLEWRHRKEFWDEAAYGPCPEEEPV